jgi:hypothetical protein
VKGRTVRWFLIGFGIATAAGAAGMMIAAVRRRKPLVDEGPGIETPAAVAERELQPVP